MIFIDLSHKVTEKDWLVLRSELFLKHSFHHFKKREDAPHIFDTCSYIARRTSVPRCRDADVIYYYAGIAVNSVPSCGHC